MLVDWATVALLAHSPSQLKAAISFTSVPRGPRGVAVLRVYRLLTPEKIETSFNVWDLQKNDAQVTQLYCAAAVFLPAAP